MAGPAGLAARLRRWAGRHPVVAAALSCGALAPLLAYPLAAACALLFRFPIPFAGYRSGIEGFALSWLAVSVYGALGGFPLLSALGACGGVVLAARCGGWPGRRPLLAVASAVACLAVLLLAVLDRLIGPW